MAAHVVPYGGVKRRRPEAESLSPSLQGVPEALASGWDGSRLLLVLILFRIINSLLVWTRFVPDEYWQCTEVAYHVIYKRGHLAWEWREGLRGYTHPLLFIILYKILSVTGLDSQWMISESPRLLQSVIAGVCDWYLYKLTLIMFNCKEAAKHTLISQLLSWFTFYCCTRTLSNSMESALSPIILYYWLRSLLPSSGDTNLNTLLYLMLMAVSVLIRPTGVIMWLPLSLFHLIILLKRRGVRGRSRLAELYKVFGLMVAVSLVSLLWSVLIDRIFYGKWVFVQYEFLQFNILQGQSSNFGTHSWHWYITQGLPAMLFTFIPFLFHGVWLTLRQYPPLSMTPLMVAILLVIVHSFIGHKEFRFVLPSLTLSMPYIGFSVSHLLQRKSGRVIKVIVIMMLLSNIPMSVYFSLIHQRGDVSIMKYLRKNVKSNSSVLFLLPCYSTPFYTHLHGDHQLQLLECLPDPGYPNIEDEFYSSPNNWLSVNIKQLPTHIVFYDVLLSQIEEFLHKNCYVKVVDLFHSHFRDNERVGHMILLYGVLIMECDVLDGSLAEQVEDKADY